MAHENATPRPWIHDYDQHGSEQVCIYADASEDLIAEMHVFRPDSQILADAALIVEAVNAYDTLRAENERLRNAGNAIRRWAMPSGLDPEIDADMRAWDQLVALSESQP